jgi:isopenicillin-N epimerase
MAGGTHWHFLHEFHGTSDRTPQMVIPEVLNFRRSLGGDDAIRDHFRKLTASARRAIESVGLRCVTPTNPALFGAMIAFELPASVDPELWRERIWHEHGIECPATRSGGRTWLRVSCSVFNRAEDIDRLAVAVSKLLA